MRKTSTTINPALSRVISETGHTDLIVVTDAGLPIPPGKARTRAARAFVRSGEYTSYANVILHAGVAY